jgi:PadR family transcriptional regulator
MHGRRPPRRARGRFLIGPGRWQVRARVERFVEPTLLLLLEERPAHGYELLDRLPPLTGSDRVDMGNLYRFLRALEEEGFVASDWDASAPGPAKRRYELTDAGRHLLMEWVDALRGVESLIAAFIDRYERGEEVTDAPPPSQAR